MQERHRNHAVHLGEVKVEMVSIPQHFKVKVEFCIPAGGATHIIEFGRAAFCPKSCSVWLVTLLALCLPMDLLLACCGFRPVEANWPFFRVLGCKGREGTRSYLGG